MLRLHLLGGLSIVNGPHGNGGLGHQRKALVLLAVIAAARTSGVTREKLLGYFWPDAPEERGKNALRQRVFALRRDFGEDELFIGSAELRLNPAVVSTDVWEFESAYAAGDFPAASNVYGGPFLDGVYVNELPELERWIEEERGRLAQLATRSFTRLATDAGTRGDHEAAVAAWRRLVSFDMTAAAPAAALIGALADAGDARAAIAHFRVYSELLRSEYDLDPDPQVLAVVERVRNNGRGRAAIVSPPGKQAGRVGDAQAEALPSSPDGPPLEVRSVEAQPTQPPPTSDVRISRAASWRWVAATLFVVVALAGAVYASMPASGQYVVEKTTRITNAPGLELDAAISPDGKFVAYAAGPLGRTRIHVRAFADRSIVSLTDSLPGAHRLPRWSADGTSLTFIVGRALYRVPKLGGTAEKLIDSTGNRFSTVLSPDGRQVAYANDSVVFVRPLAGGNARQIAAGRYPNGITWSPDGRFLAYVEDNAQFIYSQTSIGNIAPSAIWIVDIASGTRNEVADASHMNASPVWARDGRSLLFVSNAGGSRDIYQQALTRNGAPRGDAKRLTSGLQVHTISISDDGARLAYSTLTTYSDPWVVSIAEGYPSLHAIVKEDQAVENVAVSRDGQWVAFDSDREGPAQIFRVPAYGGKPIQVTRDSGGNFVPDWSPDGREIAFHSWRDGQREIFAIPTDGGRAERLTTDPHHDMYPQWAPDGRRIAFMSDRTGRHEIHLITRLADRGWSAPRVVTTTGSTDFRWSRDGRSILYQSRDFRSMMLVNVATGAARLVLDGGRRGLTLYSSAWLDDERIVVRGVDSLGTPGFWLTSLTGAAPKPLLLFQDPFRRPRRTEFATDGKRLYFVMPDDQADVWLMALRR